MIPTKQIIDPQVVDNVFALVCDHFGVTREEIEGPTKPDTVNRARMCAGYLLFHHKPCTSAVGRAINKTRFSAMHIVKVCRNSIKNQQFVYEDLMALSDKMPQPSDDALFNWTFHEHLFVIK